MKFKTKPSLYIVWVSIEIVYFYKRADKRRAFTEGSRVEGNRHAHAHLA